MDSKERDEVRKKRGDVNTRECGERERGRVRERGEREKKRDRERRERDRSG